MKVIYIVKLHVNMEGYKIAIITRKRKKAFKVMQRHIDQMDFNDEITLEQYPLSKHVSKDNVFVLARHSQKKTNEFKT